MLSDCPDTHGSRLELPKPITGLNLWPHQEGPLATRQLYDAHPLEEGRTKKRTLSPILCANNRGVRRGTFVVSPEWVSEDVSQPPRSMGLVYEPQPSDFHEARAYHAKTWETSALHPAHGTNPHLMMPGFAPYKYVPVRPRAGRSDLAGMWPWATEADTSSLPLPFPTGPCDDQTAYRRAIDTYNDRLLSRHRATSARITRKEVMNEFCSRLGANPYTSTIPQSAVSLPHPDGIGTTPELTDNFAHTYVRNLPAMSFRAAHHTAPFNAYMTFCDWGEPPLKATTSDSLPAVASA